VAKKQNTNTILPSLPKASRLTRFSATAATALNAAAWTRTLLWLSRKISKFSTSSSFSIRLLSAKYQPVAQLNESGNIDHKDNDN